SNRKMRLPSPRKVVMANTEIQIITANIGKKKEIGSWLSR
ncbi:20915_t:CDS:1, partial [Gigaspora margarita]